MTGKMRAGTGSSEAAAIRYPLSASRSRGMSLIAALFLIVVVAALGAFAVRIGSGQQQTVNLALLGNRALAAANSGVEWAARRALEESSCSNSTLNLTESALAGFTVQIECTATTHTEGSTTTTIWSITSFAQSGAYGAPDYVSRRVRARFTNAL